MVLSKFTPNRPVTEIASSWLRCSNNMGTWTKFGVVGAAAVAGFAVLCNLPTNPFVKAPEKATLEYLAETRLKTFGNERKEFKEAMGLSSLEPQLSAHGVPLYAVVHESLGVAEFQPYFKGEIFLDKERRFYGPVERTMLLSGFMRISVIWKMIENKKTGIDGNLKGEGRILGGVFVIGSGKQGILFEHREKEFGDYANTTEVLEAALRVKTSKSDSKL